MYDETVNLIRIVISSDEDEDVDEDTYIFTTNQPR